MATSGYDKDSRVSDHAGGFTVNKDGKRVRVLPIEGGNRWAVFDRPAGSAAALVMAMTRPGLDYPTADAAIRSVIGPPRSR